MNSLQHPIGFAVMSPPSYPPCRCMCCTSVSPIEAVDSSSLTSRPTDPVRRPKAKIGMTTSWMDYLLCQLTSDRRLSTLERLIPEILEPILEELHERSIDGLRAFSQVSRTCRALASPYRFKPLHVKLDKLLKAHSPEVFDSVRVILSYRDGLKTLKMRGLSCAKLTNAPDIEYVLKAERSFESFEFCSVADLVTDRISNSILRSINGNCPSLSKIVIGLGAFHGYSPGWDREYRDAETMRRTTLFEHIPVRPFVGQRIFRTLAAFQSLIHLTVHFKIKEDETALMHPKQGQHAVREMYHGIEILKEGVRLSQLGVVFSTCSSNLFGCCRHPAMVKVQFAISYKNVEKNGKSKEYAVTCDERKYGRIIDRRREVVKLYGPRAWEGYLGPYMWEWRERSEGKCFRPACIIIDSVIRLALSPSIFKRTEIEKAGRQGIFHVGD